MSPKPKPSWRPDWRDPDAHQAALNGLPMSQWRWQWIRRHDDYEQDFHELRASRGKFSGPPGNQTLLKAATEGLRQKYGLKWLLDPSVDIAPPDVTGRPAVDVVMADPERLQRRQEEGYWIVAVDVSLNASDILEQLKCHLVKERKPRQSARQRSESVKYVRILDAYAAGESAKSIAAAIDADEKDIRRWRSSGLKLQRAAIAGPSK